MKIEVVTPEESMGDVIGDLNKRRGQVEGMETSRGGARIVKAKASFGRDVRLCYRTPHHHFRTCHKHHVVQPLFRGEQFNR